MHDAIPRNGDPIYIKAIFETLQLLEKKTGVSPVARPDCPVSDDPNHSCWTFSPIQLFEEGPPLMFWVDSFTHIGVGMEITTCPHAPGETIPWICLWSGTNRQWRSDTWEQLESLFNGKPSYLKSVAWKIAQDSWGVGPAICAER